MGVKTTRIVCIEIGMNTCELGKKEQYWRYGKGYMICS